MCGIGGFFAQRTVAPPVVSAMQAALSPRGPDAQHAQLWGQNGLLHARLSIIDPRPVSDQPMANDRGDVWIVYNGEVYDWQADAAALGEFRTRSDTEFILRGYEAWGIDGLLERLRGMFAFAILDLAKGKAYLARDRMGEKPLVYCLSAGARLRLDRALRCCLPAARASASLSLRHRRLPRASLHSRAAHGVRARAAPGERPLPRVRPPDPAL